MGWNYITSNTYEFSTNDGLETIYFGKNLASCYAELEWCPLLKDVYFNGTQEEWRALDEHGTSTRFERAGCTIHFGTKYPTKQLKHQGTPFFPITHWNCIVGKPENGGSELIVPTKLSELEEDEGHRTVTDDEKEAWNAKSDFSGKYEDLDGLPEIPTTEGLATEDFVVKEVNEATTFEEIDLPDDFEGYTDVGFQKRLR